MLERESETSLVFVGETKLRGLHARSASYIVRWTAGLDATLRVTRIAKDGAEEKGGCWFGCRPPSARNFLRLVAMGTRAGETLRITAEGPDASKALDGVERALAVEPKPHQTPPIPPGEVARQILNRLAGRDPEEIRWDRPLREGMPHNPELEADIQRAKNRNGQIIERYGLGDRWMFDVDVRAFMASKALSEWEAEASSDDAQDESTKESA